MLTYGGLGLLIAGILFMVIPDKLQKDPEKAEKVKKQAPILAVVGAIALAAGLYLGGTFG